MSLLRKTGFRIVDSDGNILLYDYSQGESSTRRLTFSVGASNEPYMEYSSSLGGIAFSGTIYSGGYEVLTTNSTISVGDADTLDGQHGTYYLDYNNFTNTPTIPTVPTNVSAFTNDAGYITSADGGNAATLDGIDSTSFLRSDADDTGTNLTLTSLKVTSATEQITFENSTGPDISIDLAGSGTTELYFKNDTTATNILTLTDAGDLTVAGTIEGRNLVNDGAKLDLIEAGATADQTKADIDALGIDAATLDGIDSTSFLRSDVDTTLTGVLTLSGSTSHIAMQEDHYVFRRIDVVDEAVSALTTAYILLCKNAAANDVNGTITMDRTSGLRHATMCDILITAGSSLSPIGSCRSMSLAGGGRPSYSLVTVTYSGAEYIALKILNPDAYYETSGAYFTGRIKTTAGTNELIFVAPADISNEAAFGATYESHEINGNAVWHAGNDGSGSGLDADLLDGQQGSYYLNTSTTFGGDVSGTYNAIVVANDSHTHDTRYYTETEADARFVKLAGDTMTGNLTIDQGTAGDAILTLRSDTDNNEEADHPSLEFLQDGDLVGYRIGIGATNADTSGVSSNSLTISNTTSNGVSSFFWSPDNGANVYNVFHDGYHPNADKWTTARTLSLTGDVTGSVSWDGSGNASMSTTVAVSDADTLDGLDSTQFLRSDADDSASGVIDFLGGSTTIPAIRIKSGGNNWSEGIAIHPSSDNGYALAFFRPSATLTTNTNTWAIGNLGQNGTNNFGLLRSGLTGGVGIRVDSIFDVTQAGIFRFGFTPTVGSNSIWHAGNDGSGSGLDADTLDGIQGTNYFRCDGTYPNTDMNTTVEGYWHVASGSSNLPVNYYGHRWDWDHFNNGQWVFQMYSPTGGDPDLWIRQKRNYVATGWQKVWTSENDGTGSGLDADTLDGIDSLSFLRSDTDDIAGGKITFMSGVHVSTLSNANPLTIARGTASSSQRMNIGVTDTQAIFNYVEDTTTEGTGNFGSYVFELGGNAGEATVNALVLSKTGASILGNTVWHAGNDGSGSGLDADLLDGVQGSGYLRSDGDTQGTGRLTIQSGADTFTTYTQASNTANGRAQLLLQSSYSDLVVMSKEANPNKHGSTITLATQNTSTNDFAKWVIGQGQYQEGANILAFAYGVNNTNPHDVLGTDNANYSFRINSSGVVEASSSFDAPQFREINNTGYYLDPASTVTSLNVAGNAKIGRHLDALNAWDGTGNNRTALFLGWYTDKIILGNNDDGVHDTAYNYNDDAVISGNPFYGYMDIISRTALRAPIFYDVDDPNYFVDPNSGSRFHTLRAGDNIDTSPNGTDFTHVFGANGSSNRSVYFDGGGAGSVSVWWGSGNSPYFALDADQTNGGRLWFNNSSGVWSEQMRVNTGVQVLNKLSIDSAANQSNWGHVLIGNITGWSTTAYPTIGSTNGTSGSLIMLHNPHIPFRTDNPRSGASGRAGLRLATDTNASTYWDVGLIGDEFEIFRGASSARLLVVSSAGVVNAASSFDAPTFRDSDNSNYYVNPASQSVLTGPIDFQHPNGTTHLNYASTGDNYYRARNHYFDVSGQTVYMYDNLRFDLAYNQDDPNYYLDLDGDSNIKNATFERAKNIKGDHFEGRFQDIRVYTQDFSASGTQARRHYIGRIYFTPNHWGDWTLLEITLQEETYSQSGVTYEIYGFYGMGNGNSCRIRRKRYYGLGRADYRVALGAVTYAGWQYASQNTYYQDIYIEVDYYQSVSCHVGSTTANLTNSFPASGTGWAYVFYTTPNPENISSFNEDVSIQLLDQPIELLDTKIISQSSGAEAGPKLELFRDSSSPAASDLMGEIRFEGRDFDGTKVMNGRMYSRYSTIASSSRVPELIITAGYRVGGVESSGELLKGSAGGVSLGGGAITTASSSVTITRNATAEGNLTVDGLLLTDAVYATDLGKGISLTSTGTSSLHGLSLTGQIQTNTMWVNYATSNYNDYNENIRLFNAGNSVSGIAFGASGTGGRPENSILGFSDRFEVRSGLIAAGNDNWQLRVYNGYAEARTDYRAPLFRDSNDTNYYADLTNGGVRTYRNSGYSGGISVHDNGGYLTYRITTNNHAQSWQWAFTTNSADSATFNKYFYVYYPSGDTYAEGNMNATQFRDRSDTNYYVDPAATSRLIAMTLGNSSDNRSTAATFNRDATATTGAAIGSVNDIGDGERNITVQNPNTSTADGLFTALHMQLSPTVTAARCMTDLKLVRNGANSLRHDFCIAQKHSDGSFYNNLRLNSDGRLEIRSSVRSPMFYYLNSTGNAIYQTITGTGASILYWKHGTSNANLMYLDSSGNLTATGNVTAYSDIKLKDDIQVIDNAIDKVKQIRGVTFTRNDMHDDKRQTGVIAQEVEQVLPEVVTESDYDGIKSVAYGNMVGLLIEAIKEQQKQIEALQEQINGLTK